MGTHETQRDQWRLMRLREITGDSGDQWGDHWRLRATQWETHETQRDYWRLMRPMGTHETQRD